MAKLLDYQIPTIITDKNDDKLSKMLKLAELIQYNEDTKELSLVNGKSKIICRENGDIRIEGKSVTQYAHEGIIINGAYVKVN